MKTFGSAFDAILNSTTKAPRYAIKIYFDEAGTNYHWVTSHPGTLLPVAETEYTHNVLKGLSGTSQQIFPSEGRATIGALSFKVRDSGISQLLRDNLDAGRGLNGQKVEVYLGDETLTNWSDYELYQTQIVKGVETSENWYTFNTSDVQRTAKTKIFEVKSTNISVGILDTDTQIIVGDTSEFIAVAHGTSYSDAPSQSVIYIRIDDEIIRCTVLNATTFTVVDQSNTESVDGRGVLNTKAAEHELVTSEDADGNTVTAYLDQQPEVKEFIYLEMPAPKLAYAILTGILYNQAGATLPDHWHLGISTTFVQTTAFTGIGVDWWDPTDDTQGTRFRFEGLEDEEGKKFIETEINLILGAFMPILSDGSYSFQRQTGVLSSAGYVTTLDATNLTHSGVLTHDHDEIVNLYQINWNWDPLLEEFTRGNQLIDSNSINTHGLSPKKTIDAKGLSGSIFTAALLGQRFDSLRDRYSGPPLKVQVKGNLTLAGLEVGDIIRLNLDQLRDFTGEVSSIDRSMEVQRVAVDWAKGAVTLNLFGSSQKSSTIIHETVTSALPDAFYGTAGTEINAISFPTGYTAGAVSHFDGNNTLTGGATLSAGTYWHDGDLQLDNAITLTVTDNVQLNVKGHFQINGAVDGEGQGHAGAVGSSAVNGAAGTVGYIGTTEGYGGVTATTQSFVTFNSTVSSRSELAEGEVSAIPALDLEISGNSILGMPDTVVGTAGSAGGAAIYVDGPETVNGKDGGASGAGLVIVSRGISFGASGSINLSGADGVFGTSAIVDAGATGLYAGGGSGGASGACILLLDGSAVTAPSETKITTEMGLSFTDGTRQKNATYIYKAGSNEHSYYEASVNQGGDAFKRTFRLISEQSPVEDITPEAEAVLAVDLTEYTNTPKSAKANLSTVEITVTVPTDANYQYALIYYRVTGTDRWTRIEDPADPETSVVLSSDGTQYDFKAHSVSAGKKVSPTSVTEQITLTNIIDPVAADPAPETIILIPSVSGLELFEQGNDTEFTGKDAKFTWRRTTISEYFEVGDYSELSESLDLYFKDWEVIVYDSDLNIMRT